MALQNASLLSRSVSPDYRCSPVPKSSSFHSKLIPRFHANPIRGFYTPGSADPSCATEIEVINRRQIIFSFLGLIAGVSLDTAGIPFSTHIAAASEFADMPALRGKDYGKTKMKYPDYTETDSGFQYKDLRTGSGPHPKAGETVVFPDVLDDITSSKDYKNHVFRNSLPVFGELIYARVVETAANLFLLDVVDWDGYTIGYYGRIFEARNKTKGGSFEGDKDFFKFRIGSQEVIPAFEEAVKGMSIGGVRRIIVPPELGYPDSDYNKKGPRPTTFSGQRALDFVLRNQGLIDKTLLFDIELVKILPN